MHVKRISVRRKGDGRRFAVIASAAILLAGCDLDVVNPGPVDDSFLNDPAAFNAIVNGITRNLNWALNVVATDGGLRTREIHITDVNDWNGISYLAHMGLPNTDAPNYLNPWGHGQAARWIGEDFLRRAALQLSPEELRVNVPVARGSLWTGFANRLLGEYFCEAVFDGGPAMPSVEYMRRAEELFTAAIEIATATGNSEIATAAKAGRASVRVHLGDWEGAVADAAGVPTDFDFHLPYYTDGDWRYYNNLAYTSGYTVWNTPVADYYLATGDPRTAWVVGDSPMVPSTVDPWSATGVPNYRQLKYREWGDPIRVAGGTEMRLIEAEAFLREGDIPAAMALLTEVRARAGVEPWPEPASAEEAWALLKRERGIELWLEGRRMADLRRWEETETPGALDPHELGLTNGGPDLSNRALCIPIPDTERERNPNL